MQNNLSKYEDEIKKLSDRGMLLLNSMKHEQDQAGVRRQIKAALGDKAEEYIKKLPNFSNSYQSWYSESKTLIKQVLPDRLADFVRHYERQTNRKSLQWDNYTIEDYLQGLSRSDLVPMLAGISRMEQQVSILSSVEVRFKSSLIDIKQLVAADLFDSEVDAARELLKKNFLRAAGAICGVVLEKHLAQVCENHLIKITKENPTIADLNDALKNADVIDTPRWRANQHLADIRNLCDHNKSKEPTEDQVHDLVEGVSKILKTLF